MALLGKVFKALKQTRETISEAFDSVRKQKVSIESLDQLEETLILADLGFVVVGKILDAIKKNKKENFIIDVESYLISILPEDHNDKIYNSMSTVIFMVGVNGTGKTTSCAKLANYYKSQGKKVLMIAADTYRAAAVDQLKLWGERTDAAVISQNTGSDPAAVAYEALEYAIANNKDVLLIDTAGRLHNKENLMSELEKVVRVLRKIDEEVPQEIILILDATTGQNAHIQVETFKKLINISGLIVTKLDGSARGGVIVALADRFSLPIFAIGVGEEADDLRPFTAQNFADSLLELPR